MAEQKPITSPAKAIRQKCLDCVYDDANEVKLCPTTTCPLYPFRFGTNPFNKKTLTDKQRAEMSERAKKLRRTRQDVVKEDGNDVG